MEIHFKASLLRLMAICMSIGADGSRRPSELELELAQFQVIFSCALLGALRCMSDDAINCILGLALCIVAATWNFLC